MNNIEKFFTTTISVIRMTWSNESSAEIAAGSFSGHIQQANPELTQSVGEAWGKVFLVWCDKSEDIEPGDKLTVASGDYSGTYSIKNIQQNTTGNNQHLEIVAIKDI